LLVVVADLPQVAVRVDILKVGFRYLLVHLPSQLVLVVRLQGMMVVIQCLHLSR
jgi:hypothetical protein